MGGHTIFHLALLLTGLMVLGFHDEPSKADVILTVNALRIAHALDILFAILKFLGSAPKHFVKHRFSFRVFDTIKLFVYLGSILYAIFHE